jgi:hypothetical protein
MAAVPLRNLRIGTYKKTSDHFMCVWVYVCCCATVCFLWPPSCHSQSYLETFPQNREWVVLIHALQDSLISPTIRTREHLLFFKTEYEVPVYKRGTVFLVAVYFVRTARWLSSQLLLPVFLVACRHVLFRSPVERYYSVPLSEMGRTKAGLNTYVTCKKKT